MFKKSITTVLALITILSTSLSVSASEIIPNTETILYNENGEAVIEYVDESLIPAGNAETLSEIPTSLSPRAGRAAPTYNSTLKCYNSYTYLWAYSVATPAINKMRVTCSGKYSGGSSVGSSSYTSPSGWMVGAASAIVETPKSPFPLAIASGSSSHYYQATGYKDLTRYLQWNK